MRNALAAKSLYKGSLTREQFLFYETRITANLILEGLSRAEAIDRISIDNLFQYPTERVVRNLAAVCYDRLMLLNDRTLIENVAKGSFETAKQTCLYAIMKHNYLLWDFMVTVIGEKYRTLDFSFSKTDLNVFFNRLQEQDDYVATWSDTTITKIKQVITRILIETGYLEETDKNHLNMVLLDNGLKEAINAQGNRIILPAFNCFD